MAQIQKLKALVTFPRYFKVGVAPRAQKRESCSPPWRPCRGLSDSNPIPLDRAQKAETCVTQPLCALSPEIPGGGAESDLY